MPIPVYFWLLLVFIVGIMIGSFLNVAIVRLPLEKSLLWPGSRCGQCLQSIRWYDNLPLVSYLWLRGRCRHCQAPFSVRYFLIELLTGLGFVGLFYVEVVCNIQGWPTGGEAWGIARGFFPWGWWAGFAHHAILFCLLLVASVCDLHNRTIPLRLTMTGAVIGLLGATLMPWPWPGTPEMATPVAPANFPGLNPWLIQPIGPGIYPWPFWGPLPDFCAPGGNWQTGLLTGLAGLLAGTWLLRIIGKLFSLGLGKEALGLGDADLMMMAGAFLGWQVVVVAFFVSALPGLGFGLFQLFIRRDNSLPFGPSLAIGLMMTMLGWPWLGPGLQLFFFMGLFLIAIGVLGLGFILASSFIMRLLRR